MAYVRRRLLIHEEAKVETQLEQNSKSKISNNNDDEIQI